MKTVKLWTLATALCVTSGFAMAQGVGINASGGAPDASAGLDVNFTNKGFLPPRMNTTQRDLISAPATGLQIYNTDDDCINVYTGASWKKACFECDFSAPAVAGNSPVCAGSPINLYASAVSGATYSWTGPNGFSSSDQNPVISSPTTAASGTYVLVTTAGGCSVTSSIIVIVNSLPDASYTYAPAAVVNSTTTFTPNDTNLISYAWTIPNANPSGTSAKKPTVTWTSDGTADVILAVTDANGCVASSQQSLSVSCPPQPFGQTLNFTYTGEMQTWTVPECVTVVKLEAYGAQGGDGYRPGNQGTGGKGGYVYGDKNVTSGQVLNIYVGGQGLSGQFLANAGWNGGGEGHQYSSNEAGGGGGGASDVRIGGTTNASRVIVGAGGGGGSNTSSAHGGGGGYTNGSNGQATGFGYGASQGAGGNGGTTNGNGTVGNAGTLGQGGNAGNVPSCGGGGGGGYYGGGGGGGCNSGGGGGGSSYIGGLDANTGFTNNTRTGNGLVIISW